MTTTLPLVTHPSLLPSEVFSLHRQSPAKSPPTTPTALVTSSTSCLHSGSDRKTRAQLYALRPASQSKAAVATAHLKRRICTVPSPSGLNMSFPLVSPTPTRSPVNATKVQRRSALLRRREICTPSLSLASVFTPFGWLQLVLLRPTTTEPPLFQFGFLPVFLPHPLKPPDPPPHFYLPTVQLETSIISNLRLCSTYQFSSTSLQLLHRLSQLITVRLRLCSRSLPTVDFLGIQLHQPPANLVRNGNRWISTLLPTTGLLQGVFRGHDIINNNIYLDLNLQTSVSLISACELVSTIVITRTVSFLSFYIASIYINATVNLCNLHLPRFIIYKISCDYLCLPALLTRDSLNSVDLSPAVDSTPAVDAIPTIKSSLAVKTLPSTSSPAESVFKSSIVRAHLLVHSPFMAKELVQVLDRLSILLAVNVFDVNYLSLPFVVVLFVYVSSKNSVAKVSVLVRLVTSI